MAQKGLPDLDLLDCFRAVGLLPLNPKGVCQQQLNSLLLPAQREACAFLARKTKKDDVQIAYSKVVKALHDLTDICQRVHVTLPHRPSNSKNKVP